MVENMKDSELNLLTKFCKQCFETEAEYELKSRYKGCLLGRIFIIKYTIFQIIPMIPNGWKLHYTRVQPKIRQMPERS